MEEFDSEEEFEFEGEDDEFDDEEEFEVKEDLESENDDAVIWEIGEVVEEPVAGVDFLQREPSLEIVWVSDSDVESKELSGTRRRGLW